MHFLRDYYTTSVRSIDKELKPLQRPLNDDDYSQSTLDNCFHLLIGPSQTVERLNGCLKDYFDCKLRLYVFARECDNDNYDKAYCLALNIRNKLVNLDNIAQNEYIEEVVPVSVIPSSTQSNDRVFIFDINTRAKLAF